MDVIRISSSGDDIAAGIEREPFFEIDDKMYTLPKEVPPQWVAQYLREVRSGGTDVATAKLIDKMIGRDGLDALAGCAALTKPQFKGIIAAVQERAMGSIEEYTGN